MAAAPLTFCEKIAEAVNRVEIERRLVRPGRVEVSLDLYGLLIDEMRQDNRLVYKASGDAPPMALRGWPILPVGDMKPLEWSIVLP